MKAIQIEINGRVQGVGFRHAAVKTARQYNVKGFVKNNVDGSVTMVAEGSPNNLDEFVKWCHEGPAFAQIRDIQVTDKESKGYKAFDIKY